MNYISKVLENSLMPTFGNFGMNNNINYGVLTVAALSALALITCCSRCRRTVVAKKQDNSDVQLPQVPQNVVDNTIKPEIPNVEPSKLEQPLTPQVATPTIPAQTYSAAEGAGAYTGAGPGPSITDAAPPKPISVSAPVKFFPVEGPRKTRPITIHFNASDRSLPWGKLNRQLVTELGKKGVLIAKGGDHSVACVIYQKPSAFRCTGSGFLGDIRANGLLKFSEDTRNKHNITTPTYVVVMQKYSKREGMAEWKPIDPYGKDETESFTKENMTIIGSIAVNEYDNQICFEFEKECLSKQMIDNLAKDLIKNFPPEEGA